MKKYTNTQIGNFNPFVRRYCPDCFYLKELISLWCGHDIAIQKRGTTIPGVHFCPYWKPDWEYIEDKYKRRERGYYRKEKWWEKYYNWLTRGIGGVK